MTAPLPRRFSTPDGGVWEFDQNVAYPSCLMFTEVATGRHLTGNISTPIDDPTDEELVKLLKAVRQRQWPRSD